MRFALAQNMYNMPYTAIIKHYYDVIMGTIACQITSLTIVYSTVYWDADQRKHQSSASLAFVWRIDRGPVNSPTQIASNAENVSIWWRHHEKAQVHSGLVSLKAGLLSDNGTKAAKYRCKNVPVKAHPEESW